MNLLPVSLTLAASFLWVFGQVLGKLAMRDLNATSFNWIRFSFVAVSVIPVIFITDLGTLAILPTFLAVISGSFGLFVTAQVYFYSLNRASAHKIVTIGNSAPIWAIVLAPLLLGEEIATLLLISLGLVLGGTYLLTPKKTERKEWRLAVPLTLIYAVMWGFTQVIQKLALNQGIGPVAFLVIKLFAAGVAVNLFAGATLSWSAQRFSKMSVGLSIVSGISANLVGNICYLFALGMENVSSLIPFTSAAIPFGFLLSIWIVGERAGRKAVLGMILVFLGVVLATL